MPASTKTRPRSRIPRPRILHRQRTGRSITPQMGHAHTQAHARAQPASRMCDFHALLPGQARPQLVGLSSETPASRASVLVPNPQGWPLVVLLFFFASSSCCSARWGGAHMFSLFARFNLSIVAPPDNTPGPHLPAWTVGVTGPPDTGMWHVDVIELDD